MLFFLFMKAKRTTKKKNQANAHTQHTHIQHIKLWESYKHKIYINNILYIQQRFGRCRGRRRHHHSFSMQPRAFAGVREKEKEKKNIIQINLFPLHIFTAIKRVRFPVTVVAAAAIAHVS